jgi:hypothetical protein
MSTIPPNQHLHYGGSLNPKSGSLSPKPHFGTSFKMQKRFELIVRLENAAIPEAAAAAMLCISVPRLRYLKKNPEYLNARMKITHGIIIDHEGSLSLIKEQRKEILTQMLPPALQALANELQTPAATLAERKHKVDVARDILDREGTFAKVSRTEVKPVSEFDFETADSASRSIINAIRGMAAPAAQNGDVMDAALEFTSGRTLNASEQQEALDDLEKEALAAMDVPKTVQ